MRWVGNMLGLTEAEPGRAETPPAPVPAEAPRRQRESRSRVEVLARHALRHGGEMCISAGSVLDFGGQTDWAPPTIAIVNAANMIGLGGGGVDGAITSAGGPQLAAHRQALPILEGTRGARIATGGAVLTGPGDYGKLFAANVIHAVGPNYLDVQTPEHGDAELRSAYLQSMAAAAEAGIEYLAFSLLSAGIFRGPRSLAQVLSIGLQAVCDGAYPGLKEVHLVGHSAQEQNTLLELLRGLAPPTPLERARAKTEAAESEPAAAAGRVLAVRCDVTRPEDCVAAREAVTEAFPGRPVAFLFNNAGECSNGRLGL